MSAGERTETTGPVSNDAAKRIEEILERLGKISPTPWVLDERHRGFVYCDDSLGSAVARTNMEYTVAVPLSVELANADFIANAPQDIAWLIGELAAARASGDATGLGNAQVASSAGNPARNPDDAEVRAAKEVLADEGVGAASWLVRRALRAAYRAAGVSGGVPAGGATPVTQPDATPTPTRDAEIESLRGRVAALREKRIPGKLRLFADFLDATMPRTGGADHRAPLREAADILDALLAEGDKSQKFRPNDAGGGGEQTSSAKSVATEPLSKTALSGSENLPSTDQQSPVAGASRETAGGTLEKDQEGAAQASTSLETPALRTYDYRVAPSGMGPLADEWADKPHRLVYDLCAEIDRLRASRCLQHITGRADRE